MKDKLPIIFFLITFLWSWVFWLPFVLTSFGTISNIDIRNILIFPALFVGAFGPAVGACYSILTLKGKKELGKFLKSFLSIRFGWKVWFSIFGVLASVNIFAWPYVLG